MAIYQNYPTHPSADLRRLYRDAAEQYGDKTLFLQRCENGYREVSYRRFAEAVDALNAFLCHRGLTDKRTVIVGEACYEWVLAFMAVACTGVAVPLDVTSPTKTLLSLAAHCDASLIVCDDETDKRLSAVGHPLPRIRFSQLNAAISEGKAQLAQESLDALLPPIDPCVMHAIFYTAGSTDTPKGVMLSHRNLCFNVSEVGQMIHIGKDDVFLSLQPLHNLYECTCGILLPMTSGATVAFAGGISRLHKSLCEVSPSVILCTPTLPELLYKKILRRIRTQNLEKKVATYINSTNAIPNLKMRLAAKRKFFASLHEGFGGKLRLLLSGGESIDPAVLSGLRDFGFLALQCYTVTECAPVVAINRDAFFFDDSVGAATPNTLLDVCETGEERMGDIRFHGDNVMLGYYKEPRLTDRVLRGGWLYTGDLGYLDENGYLYIVGRKSNAIRLDAQRAIYPEELEKLLLETGIIEEAAVVGYPNPEGGIDTVAILHPDYEMLSHLDHTPMTPERLEQYLVKAIASVNAQLSPHKQIALHLTATGDFPKGKNGRLQRDAVASRYKENYLKVKSEKNKPEQP